MTTKLSQATETQYSFTNLLSASLHNCPNNLWETISARSHRETTAPVKTVAF